jgi:RNA polymerase sigma-70 factor (ECF subfamily)
VEDLVQETLLALHNRRHTYQTSQRLTPWLYAIARYKLVDLLRSQSPRRQSRSRSTTTTARRAAAGRPSPAESRRDLLKLLDTLPDRHRLPIVLVKLEGRSVAEAAAATGMSEAAVKVGIHPRPEEARARSEQAAMKTEALIAMLARGDAAVRAARRRSPPRRDRRRGARARAGRRAGAARATRRPRRRRAAADVLAQARRSGRRRALAFAAVRRLACAGDARARRRCSRRRCSPCCGSSLRWR